MDVMQKEIDNLRRGSGTASNILSMSNGPGTVRSVSLDTGGGVNKEIQRLWDMINAMQKSNASNSTNHRRKKSMNSKARVGGMEPLDEQKDPMDPEGQGMNEEDMVNSGNNVIIGVGCNEKGDLGVGDDDNIRSLGELAWSAGMKYIKFLSVDV